VRAGRAPAVAADRFPHEFSGGERQRIAIARTLAADPSVLVLDEPLAALDSSAQAQLANLLVNLSRELGLGLLLISHDLAIVRHVADQVSVMYLGRMVETGQTARVWEQPRLHYSGSLSHANPASDGSDSCPTRFQARCPQAGRRAVADFTRAARTRSRAAASKSRRSVPLAGGRSARAGCSPLARPWRLGRTPGTGRLAPIPACACASRALSSLTLFPSILAIDAFAAFATAPRIASV
jgi:ABC-type dipeptide/oligopeptide/nickel transport system ATPase component